MRRSIMAAALGASFAALGSGGSVVAAPCQTGVASAPFIGATDMLAIERAAQTLPTAQGAGRDVGSVVPASAKRAPIPAPVAKVLPQYKGYSAFRAGADLMIVDPRGILAYIMPLRGTATPTDCP